MNSRTLANILLLLMLLAFISLFISNKNEPLEVQRLTSLTLDEITNIHIPRNNNNDIVMQKITQADGEPVWQMIKPYTINAHQFRVNTLLRLSQTPINESYNISELQLQDYALDKPRARIIFNSTEISFGKSNPINNKRYLMSGNKLVLIDDQTYPLVNAQASTFIDLRLLPKKNISGLSLTNLKITKGDTVHWTSTTKTRDDNALSADQIQTLLANWRSAQAFAVHKYMPRKKLGAIEILFNDSMITFELSDDDPWLILSRPDLGIEYHLDSSLKAKLLGPFNLATEPAAETPSHIKTIGSGNA